MSAWPPVGATGRALGMGVMRLPWIEDAARAEATVAVALAAGVTVFDTARAYGEACERELAAVLRRLGAAETVSVVTKAGMRREGARWRPDGRARTLDADARASAAALGDIPIGMLLIHAPDPGVPWSTTVRALGRLRAQGRAQRIGVSNVSRAELDQALELAPISAVEVALSPFDEAALTGGVVARALERGLTVLVHAPFGGPARAARLGSDAALGGASAWAGVLAALLAIDPAIVPLPGPTRPETARAIGEARAMSTDAVAAVEAKLRWRAKLRPPVRTAPRGAGEVVVVMGLPGAGKSRVAEAMRAAGYARLNRDERGGTLAALHAELAARLGRGERRFVLDNLYLTRAGRRAVLDACAAHGAHVRLVWLDTPLVEAERNAAMRVIAATGGLPEPEVLARSKVPGVFAPTVLLRAARELEPPTDDEGFDEIEVRAFARAAAGGPRVTVVAIDALVGADGQLRADAAQFVREPWVLVFGWRAPLAAATEAALRALCPGVVEVAMCAHGGGPPRCWCRPPLLGLVLARTPPDVHWAASVLVGTAPAHAAMARALGAKYQEGRGPAGGNRRSAGPTPQS